MDNKALLALWKLEGEWVNRLGTEQPSDRITDLTACYMALVEHGEGCDNCNEV
jgi:hypothetical protein